MRLLMVASDLATGLYRGWRGMARIDSFHHAWPDTDVRYGTGQSPRLTAEKLMEEEVYPVCSPTLAIAKNPLRTPPELAGETLLHDLSMDSHSGFPTWATWLENAGASAVSTERGMKINNSAAVLQAAIDGQGVALARSVMARDDLAAGRLVRLFPEIEVVSELAYYVVYRQESAGLGRLRAFRDRLFEVARWM